MLKILLKLRLQATLARFMVGKGKKQRATKGRIALMALLWIYVFGVFLGMFFAMFASIAPAMRDMGLEWFFFAMAFMLSFAVMFVFSVFTAQAVLYEAKDNELLLSLPIPASTILTSRIVSLYLTNLGFEALVALPAIVAWIVSGGISIAAVVCFALVFICLPLFSTALSAFFGWLLALVMARMRRKNLVSTIMSLAFLAVYFYVYSNINTILTSLLTNADAIADSVGAVLPLYWMGKAAAYGSFAALLPALVCLVLPFLLCLWILSRTFIKTTTTRRGAAKVKYVEREARVASPFGALLRREGFRFLSSSTYLMNSGMGAIMALVAAVLLLIKGDYVVSVFEMLPSGSDALPALLFVAALCALSSTVTVSSCSVSLEGDNIWIAQSLPVPTFTVLKAKLALHLIVSQPALLLAQLACIIVLRPDAMGCLWLIVLPQLFGFVMAMFGLWANLRYPKLDWINEVQAVKQGMAVAIAMFGGWGLLIIPVVAGIFLLRFDWGAAVLPVMFAALLAALALALWRWLSRRGCHIFRSL